MKFGNSKVISQIGIISSRFLTSSYLHCVRTCNLQYIFFSQAEENKRRVLEGIFVDLVVRIVRKSWIPYFLLIMLLFSVQSFYAAQVHETLLECYISTAKNTSKKMFPDGTENNGENCISVIEIIRVMNFTLYFFFLQIPGNNI